LINQPIIQSIDQSTHHSINRSINQPINQSINQSIDQSLSQYLNAFSDHDDQLHAAARASRVVQPGINFMKLYFGRKILGQILPLNFGQILIPYQQTNIHLIILTKSLAFMAQKASKTMIYQHILAILIFYR
jgi:hypothetical protein